MARGGYQAFVSPATTVQYFNIEKTDDAATAAACESPFLPPELDLVKTLKTKNKTAAGLRCSMQNKKRVDFFKNIKGSSSKVNSSSAPTILCSTHVLDTEQHRLNKAELWWNQEELRESYNEQMEDLAKIASRYRSCLKGAYKSTERNHGDDDDEEEEEGNKSDNDVEVVLCARQISLCSDARGLETDFYSGIKQRMRHHRNAVFAAQTKAREVNMTFLEQLHLIRTKSQSASRPSRLVAAKMAEMDQMIAYGTAPLLSDKSVMIKNYMDRTTSSESLDSASNHSCKSLVDNNTSGNSARSDLRKQMLRQDSMSIPKIAPNSKKTPARRDMLLRQASASILIAGGNGGGNGSSSSCGDAGRLAYFRKRLLSTNTSLSDDEGESPATEGRRSNLVIGSSSRKKDSLNLSNDRNDQSSDDADDHDDDGKDDTKDSETMAAATLVRRGGKRNSLKSLDNKKSDEAPSSPEQAPAVASLGRRRLLLRQGSAPVLIATAQQCSYTISSNKTQEEQRQQQDGTTQDADSSCSLLTQKQRTRPRRQLFSRQRSVPVLEVHHESDDDDDDNNNSEDKNDESQEKKLYLRRSLLGENSPPMTTNAATAAIKPAAIVARIMEDLKDEVVPATVSPGRNGGRRRQLMNNRQLSAPTLQVPVM